MSQPQRQSDGFFDRGAQTTRLEAFVDAAFAFAVTMLVISIDSMPNNREQLIEALKGIPAFATSFAVMALFWWDHNRWSRRFGLDDGVSVMLSLAYVFLALIYVYPLKLMFSAMFGWISDGWLPSVYRIRSIDDLALMYQVYASAFASMALIGSGLNLRAWVRREALRLDELERLLLLRQLFAGAFLLVVAVASFVAAAALRQGLPAIAYSAPGMLYMLLSLQPLLGRYRRADERRLRAAMADAAS